MKKQGKYPTPKRIKSGRNLFVTDFDNKTPLVGLSFDTGNGQYFYTFFKDEKDFRAGRTTRKNYSFGVDYQTAIFRFKQWKGNNQKLSISVPSDAADIEQVITIQRTDTEKANISKVFQDLGASEKEIDSMLTTPLIGQGFDESDKFKIKSNFITDKQYALFILKQLLQDEQIKIEAIRLLKLDDLLPKEHKILPIKDILQYFIEFSTCSKKEKSTIKKIVNDFISITKKHNINDINEDDIFLYRDFILNAFTVNDFSTAWVNGCFQRLKTVFYFYQKTKRLNGEKELITKVLDHCKKLVMIKKKIKDGAKSIDVTTAKTIFDKAKLDKELYLMFLLMLNCGYYPTDIRNLKKEMIKEKDGLTYIIFSRLKTKEQFIRVNCLWSITAKLLKEQIEKNTSEYVFISNHKGQYDDSTLGIKFRHFFIDIFHTDGVKVSAKHFRDTVASNIAFDVNDNIIKITMGHCLGGKDEFWKYVQSRPEQQKPASDILFELFKNFI